VGIVVGGIGVAVGCGRSVTVGTGVIVGGGGGGSAVGGMVDGVT
jgi:hypothetical protein